MKPAYLKIIISEGVQEKINIFKKTYPKADEVSIEYFKDGKILETTMTIDNFWKKYLVHPLLLQG
jgi:hypothetical protein